MTDTAKTSYTEGGVTNSFPGKHDAAGILLSGLANAVPADPALPLLGVQRKVGAGRVGTNGHWRTKPLFEALMVSLRRMRQSPSLRASQELRKQHLVELPAFASESVGPHGITSRCSGTSHDKVLTLRRHLRPAELGRYTPRVVGAPFSGCSLHI
jgi:hypothetical protein